MNLIVILTMLGTTFPVAAGVLACRRAGASRPAEGTWRTTSAVDSFPSLQQAEPLYRAARRAPSTAGRMPAATEVAPAEETTKVPDKECVILLHGLGRTPLSMKFIEWNLTRAGYQVINVSYPSRRLSVAPLAERYLKPAVENQVPSGTKQIHFVTHSLGGIVLRQYLATDTLPNLGRVVMLAPPNQGSDLADQLRGHPAGRWILGPAGCELGTGATEAPRRLPGAAFDLGVIAGDRSLNPWFSRRLPGPDDGKVSVQSTKVQGMADFLVLHSSHTWLMWREDAVRQIICFLQNGRFDPGLEPRAFRHPPARD